MKQQTTPLFRLAFDRILPKSPLLNPPSREAPPSSSSCFHLSNSFLRNPSDKRSRKGSQTMIIRQVNIQRPRKASNLNTENDKTGIENKKNSLLHENAPSAPDFLGYIPPKNQTEQDSDNDIDIDFQPRSRLRRKSDTSSWSGGVSTLQKKIGFLMFESILPTHMNQIVTKEQNNTTGSSKMRNILKRTLLARDSNRTEGRKEFKRFGSQRDVRGVLQKSSSIRDLTQPSMTKNLSKEEGNEGLEVLPETLGHLNKDENGRPGVRSQEQSENYIPMSSKILKRKSKRNKTFLCKNQSISNDIKTTKEWILDQYISKPRKGLDKRPATIFSGVNRQIKFDNELKKFRKDIHDSVKSATQLNSRSNLFEDMMQTLIDSEPNSAKDIHNNHANFSISETGDEFDHENNHLPTIEEEILKNKRRKKTNKSERFFKDDLSKHKTAKSLAIISPLASPKPYFAPLLSPGVKDKALKRSAGEIVVPASVRTSSFAFMSPQHDASVKKDLKKETKKLGRVVRPSIAKVKEVQISYKTQSLNALHL